MATLQGHRAGVDEFFRNVPNHHLQIPHQALLKQIGQSNILPLYLCAKVLSELFKDGLADAGHRVGADAACGSRPALLCDLCPWLLVVAPARGRVRD
jgi:hypothetical protein